MNGGLIATIVAIISLLATFLVGKKTGAVKENEKLTLKMEAYTEKIKETEAKAESSENKAELATKVAETVSEKSAESAGSVASIAQMKQALDEANALEIARQQAERAKEFIQ